VEPPPRSKLTQRSGLQSSLRGCITTADNKVIDNGALSDFTAATDEIAGVDYQQVKLVDGTADSTARIPGDATNGLFVNVKALAAGQKIQLTDGTSDATVRNLAANDALNVAIVDGAGGHITTFGGTGGTSSTDDADFTPLTTPGTPVMGVYESAPTTVTDGDMGIIGINSNRYVKVDVAASELDTAHDAVDTGAPVKIGGKAQNAFPTAVANGDRTNAQFDLQGRQLTSHIAGEQFVWKQVEATATQTGTTIWDPTAGKRIAVTGYEIGTGGTTAALVTIWFGDNADTTFTQGTDQVLFRGTLTPTSTSTPGVISNLPHPVFCTTADRELHYTTSAGITIYITIYGYEW
jgi:hypothetical protein